MISNDLYVPQMKWEGANLLTGRQRGSKTTLLLHKQPEMSVQDITTKHVNKTTSFHSFVQLKTLTTEMSEYMCS